MSGEPVCVSVSVSQEGRGWSGHGARPARVPSGHAGTRRTPDVGAEPTRWATPSDKLKSEHGTRNNLPLDLTPLENSTPDHGHQPPEEKSRFLSTSALDMGFRLAGRLYFLWSECNYVPS